MVYLIHFDQKFKHAQHYLGYAENLDQRLARHTCGNGARLIAVIQKAGIPWRVARTWEGDRALERRLKKWHKSAELCPICRQERGTKWMS